MTQKTIKCFVAMAFGHKDCDLIYDNHILPILSKLKVTPVRVDRKQHHDDLNNFIVRMIKECDIVLADLTYARPSVYYEAGFAERISPVVYTARTDHLSRSQLDEQLRVHFDLEMKKIVDWKDPNDKTFSRRLKERLNYLLKPIIVGNAEKEKENLEKQNFSKLSISERCKIIYDSISSELKKKKFWLTSLDKIDNRLYWDLKHLILLIGAKLVHNNVIVSIVSIGDSITKKQIDSIIQSYSISESLVRIDTEEKNIRYNFYYYFCSLRKTPITRLTSLLPYAKPEDEFGSFSYSRTKANFDKNTETINKKIRLISPIESEKMTKQIATKIAKEHISEKTNTYTVLEGKNYSIKHIYFSKKYIEKMNKLNLL
jgi:nucleoside 2-deoxyribosyltransferase